MTSGNTHGKSASARIRRSRYALAFGACITIQLSQLADANFGHSDIISSVNGGLITNCITLFFATHSFGLSLAPAQWSLSGRSCGPGVNAAREHDGIIRSGGCLSILQLAAVNRAVSLEIKFQRTSTNLPRAEHRRGAKLHYGNVLERERERETLTFTRAYLQTVY